ncbi:MAG: helix-turn-helix transcriptional regulator [Phycisphaera sp.]|nr:MAG: helix-turn-helix transcriptional regulator [Phycisphaera sp.]
MAKGGFVIRFGEMVRQRREALELSQEELASRAGLHRTAITMIERAKRSSTLETIEKLALALQIQPSELIPDIELRRGRR